MLSETAFIIQHKCSLVQPSIFCKCYLQAISVLIHPTEFIKHSRWARCRADADRRGTLRSVIGEAPCHGQFYDQKMHRDLGKLREGGAQSRLGMEMGQREEPAWLGLAQRF